MATAIRVYTMGPLLMHDLAKSIPQHVNLQAQMRWRKLKLNLWRFVRPRNKNLINFVASLTDIRTMMPALPLELLLQILSSLTSEELMELVRSCAGLSKVRSVKILTSPLASVCQTV